MNSFLQGIVAGAVLITLTACDNGTSQQANKKPPEIVPRPSAAVAEPLQLNATDTFGYRAGELVPDLTFTDIDGAAHRLSDFRDATAIVIVVRDTGCPVSSRYAPRIARFEQEYAAQGAQFIYLNPGDHETGDAIREEITTFGFAGPYIHDTDGDIARALRIRATTEVLVLDPSLTLIYRGGIDDQYGIAYTRNEVQEPWLRRAIDATLAGTAPVVRHRDNVPGCALSFHSGEAVEQVAQSLLPEDGITYHNRISRILEDNCVVCHRNGGIGPFALDNYKAAYGYRAMINYVLNEGLMPPWYAKPGISDYANDRSLRDSDRRALLQWTAGDAPEGDPGLAVRPRVHAEGWTIGEPEYIAQLPEPQQIPAEGAVPYTYIYVKTDFPEDRWVKRLEIRPTAPEVTHHVVVTLEAPPDVEPPDPNAPWHEALNGFYAATAPGAVGTDFGDGKAKKLPAGAWLKFQMHYTTNGRAVEDQTRLGFVFQDEAPEVEVETAAAYNYWFKIPPYTKEHQVIGKYTFPAAGQLERVFPHMHNRGVAFRYDIIHPDGSETPVLQVPEYNFDWQLTYEFAEPPRFEKGAILRATGWYDNSEDNPYNPDPSKTVRHGEQTWDEMMIGYFDWSRTGAGSDAETVANN